MNAERFSEAMGLIADRYLAETMENARKNRPNLHWFGLAACLCVLLGLAVALQAGLLPGGDGSKLPPVVVTLPSEESSEPLPTEESSTPTEPSLPYSPTESLPEDSTEPSKSEQATLPSSEEPSVSASTEPTETETIPPPTTEPPTTEPPTTEFPDFPPSLPDYPSLICVNGVLYVLSHSQEGEEVPNLPLLGVIGKQCVAEELPDENFESNDALIGAEVYGDGETLFVYINDRWQVYIPYGNN